MDLLILHPSSEFTPYGSTCLCDIGSLDCREEMGSCSKYLGPRERERGPNSGCLAPFHRLACVYLSSRQRRAQWEWRETSSGTGIKEEDGSLGASPPPVFLAAFHVGNMVFAHFSLVGFFAWPMIDSLWGWVTKWVSEWVADWMNG